MALFNKAKNLKKIGFKERANQLEDKIDRKIVQGLKSDKLKKVRPVIDAKSRNGQPKERLSNFYTGKRANPLWVGAIGGGYLMTKNTMASYDKEVTMPLKLATQNAVNYGPPDIMSADGVDQESSAPRDLNASGDIVFGLHNRRRG